jgi:muramoyltetrapeptide carboxypeptidase
MTNKHFQFLKVGDIVDIIAPSSNVPGNLNEIYTKIKEILASIGLVARIPDDLILPGKDLFSTNSLEYRAKHLIYSLTNDESKAVWAIRGGYGAAKIIPFLETIDQPKKSKLLLGFSDITALHLFLQHQWKWITLHSPVLNQIINNINLLNPIKEFIFSEKFIHYTGFIPLNELAKNEQIIEASITGGNACLVQTSMATSWQIKSDNNIIFLEDVGERGYQIDRMLNHFLQAGIFDQAKAVIFGQFLPRLEPDGADLCFSAIENFARELKIPALYFPLIGHSLEHNLPLPLGMNCTLKLKDSPELIFDQSISCKVL